MICKVLGSVNNHAVKARSAEIKAQVKAKKEAKEKTQTPFQKALKDFKVAA